MKYWSVLLLQQNISTRFRVTYEYKGALHVCPFFGYSNTPGSLDYLTYLYEQQRLIFRTYY